MKISDDEVKKITEEVVIMLNENIYDVERCQDAMDFVSDAVTEKMAGKNLNEDEEEEFRELIREGITYVPEHFKLD